MDSHDDFDNYALDYMGIKQLIQDLVHHKSEQRDFQFQDRLEQELKKVNHFVQSKHDDIERGLQEIAKACSELRDDRARAAGNDAFDDGTSAMRLKDLENAIHEQADQIVRMDLYVRTTYENFQKLVDKFDNAFGVSGCGWWISHLRREPFCNVAFDDLLIWVNLCWIRHRSAESAVSSGQDKWVAPTTFVRNTSKYWVKPENVIKLKVAMLKHLPYLIYGKSEDDMQKQMSDPLRTISAKPARMEESQLLSSVYFDSTDAHCFTERMYRAEGSRLLRFRWYGQNDGDDEKSIFVERKIHHEGWAVESSKKERFVLPQRHIASFVRGTFDIDAWFDQQQEKEDGSRELAHEVRLILIVFIFSLFWI